MDRRIGFQREVRQLVAKRTFNPPQKQGIVFVGSSIIRLWKTLEADMSPLPVVNQGFGGSKTWEVLNYADKLVIPYEPSIVVYYCGSNDINAGRNALKIELNFQAFVKYVWDNLPKTQIFFISINRSPQKQNRWHIVDAANQAIARYCRAMPCLQYIDVNLVLFDSLGKPRLELFESDSVHLKPTAYKEFTQIIKPILEDAWHEEIIKP